MVDGILNINKPLGKTSFSLVARVKRLTGEKRVGHAGTLDPAASGVLPVCLGQGTRIIEFLGEATKTYRAEIELGITTETYDANGKITRRQDPSGISRNQLASALASFSGLIWQTPPMYSAVKYHGQPLYKLARAGIKVERSRRLTTVHHLELIDWQAPVVTIGVVCSKGTYIRCLAQDLGEALGCGAYLKNLIRLSYGPFDIKDAVSLPQLEDAGRYGYWQHFVYPVDSVLSHWATITVSDDDGQQIRHGRPLILASGVKHSGNSQQEEGFPTPNRCRAYDRDGHFLAVLRFNPAKGQWQPEKVFS